MGGALVSPYESKGACVREGLWPGFIHTMVIVTYFLSVT